MDFQEHQPISVKYKQGGGGTEFLSLPQKTRSVNTPAVMAHRSVWRCQGWQLVCVCSVVCPVVPACPETGGVQIEQGEHQAPHQAFECLHPTPTPSCLPHDSLRAGKAAPAIRASVGRHARNQRGTKALQQPVFRCRSASPGAKRALMHRGSGGGRGQITVNHLLF